MKVTFEKRIYHIEDGEDVYEVTELIKHPNKEYDHRRIINVAKYMKLDDLPGGSGFHYHVTTDELMERIKETLNQNKDE